MHLIQLVINSIALLSVGVVSHPLDSSDVFQPLVRRVESPDNTCGLAGAGNNHGYTCGTTAPCCSQSGWCGSNTDYCGTGCQSAYGNCSTVTTDPVNAGDTAEETCGPLYGNKRCSKSQCCSPSGFCGTTEEYCTSPDCLRGFGVCDSDKTPDGATTLGSSRKLFGSVPYGVEIYDCDAPGTIALTYDDGPFSYTTDLLDILKTHNAKATFFVNGVNLGKGMIDDPKLPWAAMIKRMISDGHQVASHSWSHADLSTLNETEQTMEMIKNEMALRNIIGKWPTYMRPPYSSCNEACMATMRKLGYHVCYFDLDTEDYLHATPATNYISQKIVHDNLAMSEDNWLSIMHDIHEQTVYNLTSYFLGQITAEGFKTVTVGKCLNDPEANWYRST
ncbi:glycoside hydrolase/deacetylase [Terfezia boudieri ATCC MYA-4762]|uniref:Glycoside hydrolase/deacetylase n=1 Tax=Terfezia boudieri ATCC MYA-4762 TaxID=1051890 RepID=A0A3N4LV87_9PEZI|nr:glycoside hydrolase/deacetylase [Terfezia boudieri ATCC MYA-4762]